MGSYRDRIDKKLAGVPDLVASMRVDGHRPIRPRQSAGARLQQLVSENRDGPLVQRRWWVCGWAGQRPGHERFAGAVGDDEVAGGSGEGDTTTMVEPVAIGTHQHQIPCKFGIYPH